MASVLLAAFLATAINEIFRWAAIAAITLAGRLVPVLDIGPVFLAILVPFLFRRSGPALAAKRADACLGLNNRLASFVDFAGRSDVPPEVRNAQARETERALAGRRPAAAAPIGGWLVVGPLLLVASLAYPIFFFTSTETVTMQVLRQLGVGAHVAGDAGQEAGHNSPAGEGQSDAAGENGKADDQAASDQARVESQTARQQDPAAAASVDGTAEKTPDPDRKADAAAARPPADHLEGREPGTLVSERVGSRLARVVDPLFAPENGSRQQPAAAAGTISIDLVPKGRTGRGARAAPGQAELPERVLVDLDTLPEQYRPLVKTYFELLAAGAPAVGEATTPPARSGIP